NNLPIFPTVASHFNDPAMLILYNNFIEKSNEKYHTQWHKNPIVNKTAEHYVAIIPTTHKNYLAEISQIIRTYRKDTTHQAQLATLLYQLEGTLQEVPSLKSHTEFIQKKEQVEGKITLENKQYIKQWPQLCLDYQKDFLEFEVRNQTKKLPLTYTSQSGTKLSKIQLPKYKDWGSILAWILKENLPGRFPYTSGVYELKRTTEDPTRMFAGEGCPERTNHRFHYVSEGQPAIRLSTAFDSVTLYGENPDLRDDIFGKIGNAGVSIATLDDIKKLYSGFDLNNPNTSVSMTINGPSPVILAFFLNAAIDQACETYITQHNLWTAVHKKINQIYGKQKMPLYNHPELHQKLPKTHSGLGLQLLGISGNEVLEPPIYNDIKQNVLKNLRGTVQADILKEDQAQNTCIFSTEFALKLMGDIQVYFSENKIRNFYSISISGYHIAEAGANPITQLAFTLANGFSFVEYFINRGLDVNVFAPNLSFFFSNGMDEEYAVIGRVARRIWAITMKQKYGADDRAQKLKYHIQTSGRSLHAQEIDFNDIRTTLQALYAIYDQCNSLHTNAYDEAITTPTTESVRRAIAIQLIINKELGTARMENFIQGSFVIEELTNLVEEAVLKEFDRINERGGVLGAMERMYQRSKIQDESLDYEHKKHTGEIPIIGVNTFIGEHKIDLNKVEVFRSTTKEKMQQIDNLNNFHKRHQSKATEYLKAVQAKAQTGGNVFSVLMEAVKYCSLGQISQALFEVGGKYRRNM
ncbi:MAG: methylmalonyl-CoA mutase family protein, partial [Alphaproteobacteria bacterium]|nr:methylmalonyl-CoA mutase family protein [Alphaproteobacteria bacterium]